MGLIDQMRDRIQNSGRGRSGTFYIRSGDKKRIRFLRELDKGMKVVVHDKFGSVNVICKKHFGQKCKYCKRDDVRTRDNFVWPIYNYNDKEVQLFMFKANENTPIPALIAMYESYGTILDRDYVIARSGERFDTTYSVVPMDRKKFKKEVKVPSDKKIMKKLSEALNQEDDSDDDYDDDDVDEEDEDEEEEDEDEEESEEDEEEDEEEDDDYDEEDDE